MAVSRGAKSIRGDLVKDMCGLFEVGDLNEIYLSAEYFSATYFSAIREAKLKHWNHTSTLLKPALRSRFR